MTGNDRYARNQDGTTTTRTGEDLPDDDFAAFAVWVNEPVSSYSKHHVPEDLREAIHAVDDPRERQRLRAVVEAYERSELSPRDFARLIVESDHIDYFDPLSTPEGWGKDREDHHAPPPNVPVDDVPDAEPEPPAAFPWVEVLIGLLIVAGILAVVWVVTGGFV